MTECPILMEVHCTYQVQPHGGLCSALDQVEGSNKDEKTNDIA
jgi:hypothetical protein